MKKGRWAMRDYKNCSLFVTNAVYYFHKFLSTPEIRELSVFPVFEKDKMVDWADSKQVILVLLFTYLFLSFLISNRRQGKVDVDICLMGSPVL